LSLWNSASFIADGFDVKKTTHKNIRFAFVITLPFRLRVGNFYRHHFICRDKFFEIILRNPISIPENSEIHKILFKVKSHDKLWTEAIIVSEQPTVGDDSLGRIRSWKPNEEKIPIRATGQLFYANRACNHFIVAYSTAIRQIFGGRALRLIRMSEFTDYIRWEETILCPAEDTLPDDFYMQMFNLKPKIDIIYKGSITGELHDISKEELEVGIDRVLSRQNDFIHFELAFEAKSKMSQDDFIGALLMAVAALESAHAAFVQHELGSRLTSNFDKDLPNKFLRGLGMSLCNSLTPILLMETEERPSPKIIKNCSHGIEIRNEIMHALKNKQGKYRLRTRTNKEISEAYSSILEVYDCYVEALEKRINKSK